MAIAWTGCSLPDRACRFNDKYARIFDVVGLCNETGCDTSGDYADSQVPSEIEVTTGEKVAFSLEDLRDELVSKPRFIVRAMADAQLDGEDLHMTFDGAPASCAREETAFICAPPKDARTFELVYGDPNTPFVTFMLSVYLEEAEPTGEVCRQE